MAGRVLAQTRFRRAAGGWDWPAKGADGYEVTSQGLVLSAAPGKTRRLAGPGVHTRSGDRIELTFQPLDAGKGALTCGFAGGMEHGLVTLDLARRRVTLRTSDWTRPQPAASARFALRRGARHLLAIEKTAGAGNLVKSCDIAVQLDGETILRAADQNLLPEIGVLIEARGTRVLLERFVHRGKPSGVPEYLHVGGWQMPNEPSIEKNLAALYRGLRRAAAAGVELLVTPETSLTGLFPRDPVTRRPKPIAAAERRLRRFIRGLKGAPHVIVGLPVWQSVPGHRRNKTRFNASRLYDPDGHLILSGNKIHSCEAEFWHGYRYHEFDVCGVPATMHICHDGRYPDLWTLPIMFGARLVIHPANGGNVSGSVDGFERRACGSTGTSHAFYIHVNGGGGSYIAGPQKFHNLLAVSDECRRDNPAFPAVGPARECLLQARVRIHDAYGYWPARSFRASEQTARAFIALYHSRGGSCPVPGDGAGA